MHTAKVSPLAGIVWLLFWFLIPPTVQKDAQLGRFETLNWPKCVCGGVMMVFQASSPMREALFGYKVD